MFPMRTRGIPPLANAAQWLAYALSHRRFADTLAGANARLGADADRYSPIVGDFYLLHFAGFDRRAERSCPADLHNGRCVQWPHHGRLGWSGSEILTGHLHMLSGCCYAGAIAVQPGPRCHETGLRKDSGYEDSSLDTWTWGLSLVALTIAIHATGVTFMVSVLHTIRIRLESRSLGLPHVFAIVISAICVALLPEPLLRGRKA